MLGVSGTFFFVPNFNGDDPLEDFISRAYLAAHGLEGNIEKEELKVSADEGIPSNVV